MLVQLLCEIQHNQSRSKVEQEESNRLLAHLIGASQLLTKPYVAPILTVLIPRLTLPVSTSLPLSNGAITSSAASPSNGSSSSEVSTGSSQGHALETIFHDSRSLSTPRPIARADQATLGSSTSISADVLKMIGQLSIICGEVLFYFAHIFDNLRINVYLKKIIFNFFRI